MSKPGINGRTGKPILIILEGADKSGKSTLYQALRRATNYQPLVIDRFIGSNFAYDRVFGREDREEEYFDIEKQLSEIFDIMVVFLCTDNDTLFNRGATDKEKEDIIAVKIPYNTYLNTTRLKIEVYNTRDMSTEEIVENIVEIIHDKEEGI